MLSPHNPYQEKNSAFECGFHSFLGQKWSKRVYNNAEKRSMVERKNNFFKLRDK
jgi:NADH:ubiquinone oxidoreductase subunit 3 (subunit A)